VVVDEPELRSFCFATAAILASSHARAGENNMPIDFVGEWCASFRDDKGVIDYSLPSWTDGKCTDILSIDKWGFYFHDQKKTCRPVGLRLKQDTAPSGTAYMAMITARCVPDGVATAGTSTIQTFGFKRYKGSLTITQK
jgi:hypothetical protein